MRIVINKTERECEILPAPPNSFYIDECAYGFPLYVAIVPAVTEHERSIGNILTCPIFCHNNGYDSATPTAIQNYLTLQMFEELLHAYYEEGFCYELADGAKDLFRDFEGHGVKMDERVKQYVEELTSR